MAWAGFELDILMTQASECWDYMWVGALCLAASPLFFFFGDQVLLCGPDWPGISYVNQAGPELRAIHLPRLPKAGIQGVHHHTHQLCLLYWNHSDCDLTP